jgi:excisionase family DNA binding protein
MSSNEDHSPLVVSISEAARRLSLGRTKVYELIASGQLKTLKLGRRTLITMASVQALVARAS